MRILRLPSPGIAARRVQVETALPAELAGGERNIGVARGDVARPTRYEFNRNGFARGSLEGLHRFEHRVAAPRSQVHRDRALAAVEESQRGHVPAGKVHDVHIVADSGAIPGAVIVAEDA